MKHQKDFLNDKKLKQSFKNNYSKQQETSVHKEKEVVKFLYGKKQVKQVTGIPAERKVYCQFSLSDNKVSKSLNIRLLNIS